MNELVSLSYEDIKKMKITYIKESVSLVRFKIDDTKYQVEQWPFHTNDLHKRERVADVILSRYDRDANTYIKLYLVTTKKDLISMISDISERTPHSGHINYSNVDKMYLIKMLTDIGIFTGYFQQICDLNRKEQGELDERIYNMQQEILKLAKAKSDLYIKRMGKTGRGSKLYGQDFKGKISDRVVGSGYKPGEYVERVHARIGDTHPEYGGVLTDLRNLPYGTYIHCTNGDWYATVSCNDHGDKVLNVLQVVGSMEYKDVKIREDNCLIYIDNLESVEE